MTNCPLCNQPLACGWWCRHCKDGIHGLEWTAACRRWEAQREKDAWITPTVYVVTLVVFVLLAYFTNRQ